MLTSEAVPFLRKLFDNNKAWADQMTAADPDFFRRLAGLQTPEILWIGCSDSRVPANEIVGLPPGAVFVHRNIANIVHSSDMNCLSVMQYAIDNLRVRHIVVVGHYGCGGVGAVVRGERLGMIDNWLHPVRRIYEKAESEKAEWQDGATEQARWDRMCELNVVEQVRCVAETTAVREAWTRFQPLAVHGWIYGLRDGLLRDLEVTVESKLQAA
jgi:carbonic anhydrase